MSQEPPEVERLTAALVAVVNLLGPNQAGCSIECSQDACATDAEAALRAARRGLGIADVEELGRGWWPRPTAPA